MNCPGPMKYRKRMFMAFQRATPMTRRDHLSTRRPADGTNRQACSARAVGLGQGGTEREKPSSENACEMDPPKEGVT